MITLSQALRYSTDDVYVTLVDGSRLWKSPLSSGALDGVVMCYNANGIHVDVDVRAIAAIWRKTTPVTTLWVHPDYQI